MYFYFKHKYKNLQLIDTNDIDSKQDDTSSDFYTNNETK